MLITIILASLAGLIYANVGFKVGVDVGKDLSKKYDAEDAMVVGVLAGLIWPLLIVTLISKQRKNKLLQETTAKALLAVPDVNPESPVEVGQKLLILEEKKARLDQEVSELGKQLEELKVDPELSKVLKFPKRL